MQKNTLGLLLLPLLLLILPNGAQGQPSNTRGFMLGFQLQGASQALQNQDEPDAGGGAALALGYGFNDRLTLYLGASGATIEPEAGGDAYDLVHVDLGVLVHFRSPRRAWVPYLNAALTARASMFELPEGQLNVGGGGLSLGGGVRYYVSPVLGLDLSGLLMIGEYTEARFGGVTVDLSPLNLDTDAASFRLGLGLAWFPQRSR